MARISEIKRVDIDVLCTNINVAPVLSEATTSGFNVSLSWTNTNSIFDIEIYRSESSISGFALVTTVAEGATSYTDETSKQTTYYYKIKYTASSLYSNIISTTTSIQIVSIQSSASYELRTHNFDGTTWTQVGNANSLAANVYYVTALTTTRCALAESTNLDVYDWDGTDWAKVGATYVLPRTIARLTALSSTRIAILYATAGTEYLATYEYSGGTWAIVGNELTISISSPYQLGMATLTSTRIAIADGQGNTLKAYDFDGTDWAELDSIGLGSVSTLDLTGTSNSSVVLVKTTGNDIVQYNMINDMWGIGVSENVIGISAEAVTNLGSTTIVIYDDVGTQFQAYKISGNSWIDVGNPFDITLSNAQMSLLSG